MVLVFLLHWVVRRLSGQTMQYDPSLSGSFRPIPKRLVVFSLIRVTTRHAHPSGADR